MALAFPMLLSQIATNLVHGNSARLLSDISVEVLTGLKTKVSAGLSSFLGAPREQLTPGLFPLLEASRILWLTVPPSSELAVAGLVPPESHQSDALFCLPLPLLRTSVITSGNLLILGSV